MPALSWRKDTTRGAWVSDEITAEFSAVIQYPSPTYGKVQGIPCSCVVERTVETGAPTDDDWIPFKVSSFTDTINLEITSNCNHYRIVVPFEYPLGYYFDSGSASYQPYAPAGAYEEGQGQIVKDVKYTFWWCVQHDAPTTAPGSYPATGPIWYAVEVRDTKYEWKIKAPINLDNDRVYCLYPSELPGVRAASWMEGGYPCYKEITGTVTGTDQHYPEIDPVTGQQIGWTTKDNQTWTVMRLGGTYLKNGTVEVPTTQTILEFYVR